ncbi:MAG: phosphonate ABC transporter, permease protein PhnE [Chloroflexi bacterium]|nr:phosphonate ABC transporter, permease protein PhnE [Chloroflexota bacterium]
MTPDKADNESHSPKLAAVGSALVPGLGQFFGGRRARGWGILAAVAASAGLVSWYGEQPFWYVVPAIIWLWGVWDASAVAEESSRPLLVPVIAVLAMSYGIGWQVTKIELATLTKNIDRAAVILGPMLRPDFVGPRLEIQEAFVSIEVPCSANPPPGQRSDDGLSLVASAGCGKAGDELSVSGSGFWPGAGAELWWEDTIGERQHLLSDGQIIVVEPDADGTFSKTIFIPQMRSGTGQEANLDQPLPERFLVIQARPLGGLEITENGMRVLSGILETLSLALMATTLSLFAAVPLGFLAARNLMGGTQVGLAIYLGVRTVLNFLRSIEPLIIAIVFVVVVGLGPFAGMLAIMVHSVAALAKLYSEVVESVEPGPIEAVRATGASWSEVVRYGVVPQVIPSFTSFTLYRWDINVRSSIIIGFVGGGGIGAWLFQWIILADYRAVGASFVAIALVVIVLDNASSRLRERIV